MTERGHTDGLEEMCLTAVELILQLILIHFNFKIIFMSCTPDFSYYLFSFVNFLDF